MKVYTRTGDEGTTSLVGGERVSKTDERVEAYGTLDELMAFTALLGDLLREDPQLAGKAEQIDRILSQSMTAEASLAAGEGARAKIAPLGEEAAGWLESCIDAMQEALPPITKFTIPGGHKTVSMCHVCRTVCRRAERAALRADRACGVDRTVLVYLNRLSDYFYLLGRTLTEYFAVPERFWIP